MSDDPLLTRLDSATAQGLQLCAEAASHPHLRLVERLPPPPDADPLERFIGDVDIIDLRGTAVPDRVHTWQRLGFIIRRLLAIGKS